MFSHINIDETLSDQTLHPRGKKTLKQALRNGHQRGLGVVGKCQRLLADELEILVEEPLAVRTCRGLKGKKVGLEKKIFCEHIGAENE